MILGKPVHVRRRSLRAHTDTIEVLVMESAEFELPEIGATACLMVRLSYTAPRQCHDVSCPVVLPVRREKAFPQALFGRN